MASDDTVQQELEQARALFEERIRQDEARRLEEEQHSFSEQNKYNNSTAGDDDGSSGDSGDARSHQQTEELTEDPVTAVMEQNEPLDILADAMPHPSEEEYDHSHGDHLDHADIFNAAATHQDANDYKWIKKAMVEQSGGDTSFKTSFDKKNKEDEETRAFKNFQTYMAVKSFGAQTEQIRIASEQLGILAGQTDAEIQTQQGYLDYSRDVGDSLLQDDEMMREIMREHGYDPDNYDSSTIPSEVIAAYEETAQVCTFAITPETEQEQLASIAELENKKAAMTAYQEKLASGEMALDELPPEIQEKLSDPQTQRDIARDQFIRDEFGITEQEAYDLAINEDPKFAEIEAAVVAWEEENPVSSFENNTEPAAVTTTVTAKTTASSYASGIDGSQEDQLTSQTAFAAAADPAQPAPTAEPAPESPETDPALQQQQQQQPQSLGL